MLRAQSIKNLGCNFAGEIFQLVITLMHMRLRDSDVGFMLNSCVKLICMIQMAHLSGVAYQHLFWKWYAVQAVLVAVRCVTCAVILSKCTELPHCSVGSRSVE